MRVSKEDWIGFDLDRSLAKYNSGDYTRFGEAYIGEPIPESIERLKKFIDAGIQVKIVTARDVNNPTVVMAIIDWCHKHIGFNYIPVVNNKDHKMAALYDDRAIQLEPNTGKVIGKDFILEN